MNVDGKKLTSTKARNLKNNLMATMLKTVKDKFSQMEKLGNHTSRI